MKELEAAKNSLANDLTSMADKLEKVTFFLFFFFFLFSSLSFSSIPYFLFLFHVPHYLIKCNTYFFFMYSYSCRKQIDLADYYLNYPTTKEQYSCILFLFLQEMDRSSGLLSELSNYQGQLEELHRQNEANNNSLANMEEELGQVQQVFSAQDLNCFKADPDCQCNNLISSDTPLEESYSRFTTVPFILYLGSNKEYFVVFYLEMIKFFCLCWINLLRLRHY